MDKMNIKNVRGDIFRFTLLFYIKFCIFNIAISFCAILLGLRVMRIEFVKF